MADFNVSAKITLPLEGGYSDNPDDLGGPTKYGITQAEAREWGYQGDMRDLPLDTALAIFKKNYWDVNNLDNCPSQKLANKLFDAGVNCGIEEAAIWLQRSLNAMDRNNLDWKDLTIDGNIGPNTLNVINKALSLRREDILIECINIQQGNFYIQDALNHPTQKTFLNGWIRNRIESFN